MIARLFLTRHGETEANAVQRLAGSSDIPLSKLGERQAEVMANILAPEKPDHIYSSPMFRAMRTVRPLASILEIDVVEAEGLREIDFGAWEGMNFDEIKQEYPNDIASWIAHDPAFTFPGGENIGAFFERVDRACHKIINDGNGVSVVTTHGGVIRRIMRRLLDLTRDGAAGLHVPPGSITTLECDGSSWSLCEALPRSGSYVKAL